MYEGRATRQALQTKVNGMPFGAVLQQTKRKAGVREAAKSISQLKCDPPLRKAQVLVRTKLGNHLTIADFRRKD